jgi:hypothetical protein
MQLTTRKVCVTSTNFGYGILNSTEDSLWAVVELYTNMDLALIAEILPDVVLDIFETQEWTNPADHPCNLSRGKSRKFTPITPHM